ncbi:MAG: proline dehydrogenase family protein [Bacteroidia bacterium]|nr:proline dehydrogenase family protein [Bacteroidia bacterium]
MEGIRQIPDFNNTELAFKAKTDRRLRQDYRLMRAVDSPFVTWLGPKLLNLAFRLRLPVEGLVRKTLFQLFGGGESIEGTIPRSEELATFGVKTILDYSVEGGNTEDGFDATAAEIVRTLIHGGKHPQVAFCACKITGLARNELLEKIQSGKPLDDAEKVEFQRVRIRVEKLAETAFKHKTPLFIDAEESWIQDVIDQLAEEMMEKYNRETPVIYTTVQLYRHDRRAYLENLIEKSHQKNYLLGVKLVRGAYLEKETNRAREMGYLNPIQPDKTATDRDYDAAVTLCLDSIAHVAFCAGSHNEASSLRLAEQMEKKNLPPSHPHIWFAQLLGMSDHISFNLAAAGYNVAKYLPYGPVKAVMPYLIRRAEENTSIKGQSSREVELLAKEVQRRKN